jgi:hypothetical protein
MLYQMNVAVKIKVTDEKVLRKETTSMPKEAEGSFSPRPATPRVFTDRSGDLIDSGVVSGVYGSPDGVNGSGGVSKDCGGVPKVGVPVDSDGAPGGPGQVPEIPLMPSDGSKVFIIYLITGLINGVLSGMVNEILLGYGSNVNRASEGEQLWSPDPPTPSAGEVCSTIPATKMATDNQLKKIANPQVVWYTHAITTIVHTFDYMQRLQRGMVESICKKKSQRQRPCYFTDMNINCFLSTNPERNLAKVLTNPKEILAKLGAKQIPKESLAKVPTNLEGNFSDGILNIKPSDVRGNQPMLLPQVLHQRIIQFLGGC